MMTERVIQRHVRALVGLGLLILTGSGVAGIEEGERHTGHPDWMEPAFIDLETDLETVRAQGKTGIMVLFTTQGCTYFAEFIRTSLGDPATARRVQDNFVAIGLEIFDDVEMTDMSGDDLPIKAFAERHKAGMAPTLLFFGPDGETVVRPGDCWSFASGVPHGAEALEDSVVIEVFSPVREDYLPVTTGDGGR